MSDRTEKTRPFGRLPSLKSLKVMGCAYFKPGAHKIDVARLKIGSDANVCVHLQGNRDGFVIGNPSTLVTMMGITISAPRGFLDLLTGHKVHRRWSTIKIIDGIPYLNEWHTDTKGPLYGWDHRSINIFKKYGDSIPTRYDPHEGRRYTEREYDELLDDFSTGEWMLPRGRFYRTRSIPVLGNAYLTGRVPKHIAYRDAGDLRRVFTSTWSAIEPETREEKIADRLFKTLGKNIVRTSTTFEIVLDRYERPGLIAVFGAHNMVRGTFTTGNGLEHPHIVNVRADADLKRLSLAGFLDVRDAYARVASKVRMIPDKLPTVLLHVTNIDAPISHNGITGRIVDGKHVTQGLKPGIHLAASDTRLLTSTANLRTRYRIPAPGGAFIVEGDVLARFSGRWNGLDALPRIAYGRNLIEVRNMTLHREGSNDKLIAGGRLVVSDRTHEKRRIKSHYPGIPMINAGFAVHLSAPFANGGGFSRGSAATYIHMPLNRANKHYDLRRFSLQNVLEVAFQFVTENQQALKGNLTVTQEEKGWNILAKAKADILKLRRGTIIKPQLGANLRLRKKGRLSHIDIHRISASARRVQYNNVSMENILIALTKGGLTVGSRKGRVRLDKFLLTAQNIRTRTATIGSAAFASSAPLELSLDKDSARLKKLSTSFSLMHMRPRRLRRTFNFKGHVSGEWQGKSVRLSLRLDKKSLAGTHLVISRISKSRGGRYTAAFCLRKPTNTAQLGSLGIHSRSTIWFITGSDRMPLTASAILGQLGIYRGRGQRRGAATHSARVRRRCERLFGVRR